MYWLIDWLIAVWMYWWTGAPRDSKENAHGSVLLAVKQSDKLMIQQTLRGEQTGSYFGNAVATSDLNNDG